MASCSSRQGYYGLQAPIQVAPICACLKGRSPWISFIWIRYGAAPPLCPPFRRNGMRDCKQPQSNTLLASSKRASVSWSSSSTQKKRVVVFFSWIPWKRRVLGFFCAPKLPCGSHGIRAVLINTRVIVLCSCSKACCLARSCISISSFAFSFAPFLFFNRASSILAPASSIREISFPAPHSEMVDYSDDADSTHESDCSSFTVSCLKAPSSF